MEKNCDNTNQQYKAAMHSFLSGCFSGVAQVLVGQPFDIVKVRIQNQSPINPVYGSVFDCASSILHKEGSFAFYKGTMAPLASVPMCTSVQFGLNSFNKSMMERFNVWQGSTSPKDLSLIQYTLCGAVAGFGNSFVATPAEHIRIRMQDQANMLESRARYSSSFDAFRSIYRSHGTKGIFKGLPVTMLRDSLGFAIFFGYYETSKNNHTKMYGKPSLLKLMYYGGVGGFLLWLFTYPIDICKTKLQLEPFVNPRDGSARKVFSRILKTEGARGFAKGITPCLVRAPFASAVIVGTFEVFMEMLSSKADSFKFTNIPSIH